MTETPNGPISTTNLDRYGSVALPGGRLARFGRGGVDPDPGVLAIARRKAGEAVEWRVGMGDELKRAVLASMFEALRPVIWKAACRCAGLSVTGPR